MKKFIVVLFILSTITIAQRKENVSRNTWILVYNDSTKTVIAIVEPGYHTRTKFELREFDSKQELDNYIETNNLIKKEEKL